MRFFKASLSFQMLVATLMGVFFGIFLGDLCDVFAPFASAYIMILKITAVPYLIVAIIRGVGQLSGSQSLEILKKGILFIGSTWIINVGVIYTIRALFPSPQGHRITSYNPVEPPSINFAELLIPDNIFYDLSHNVVPAIVIFCLLIGIALIHNTEKMSVLGTLGNILNLLTRITGWISRITPIGTFLIIAHQFGSINLSTIKQVSTYIILYILGVAGLTFWIFPRILSALTSIPALQWLRSLAPILFLAYTTNFVIVCLPFIIEVLQKQIAKEFGSESQKAQNEVQGIVSVIFNLPLGSLFISVFVLFLSVFYNAPLALASNVQLILTTFLTSLGAVGLGSWINSLSFLLDALMLPQDAVHLYITTLPFTSGFQSMLSVMQISTLGLLVTLACHKHLHLKFKKLVKGAVFTFGPVFIVAMGIKVFNPLPPIQSATKSIYDLSIDSEIPVMMYEAAPKLSTVNHYPSTLDKILQTKTLRVGFTTFAAPFAFINAHGELAGFDIAFAYQLAFDLGCRLEFVPIDFENLTAQVSAGSFDIGMSAISMNETRIQNALFSNSYLTSAIVMVMSEEKKKKYRDSSSIFENPKLRIASVRGTAYAEIARQLFPHHNHIFLENYDSFAKNNIADVLIWDELEAVAWILKHRSYRVLFPNPAIGLDTFCYLLKNDDFRFQQFINDWLVLKKNEGFFDHQYELWIKGKTDKVELQERRWSIVRNILHWAH